MEQELTLNDKINVLLKQPTWTVETAIDVIATIQLHKRTTSSAIGLIGRIQTEAAEFISGGIDAHKLHVVDEESFSGRMRNILTGAAGGVGLQNLASKAGTSAIVKGLTSVSLGNAVIPVTPVLITGTLAISAIKIFQSGRKKGPFLSSLLIPAEVAAYAKSKGKWFDAVEVASSKDIHPSTGQEFILPPEQITDRAAETREQAKRASKGKNRTKSGDTSARIGNTEEATMMTDKRWGTLRKMKSHVDKYVLAEATREQCTCLPRHMLHFVLNLEASPGKKLIDTDILSKDATLEHIRKLFSRKNIKRPPKKGGPTPKNTCDLHATKKPPKS